MSSGIPSVPVAKAAASAAAAATNGSDDEDEPHNKGVGDDTDAESGGEDVLSNSNADSDNDDTSSVGATTDTDATDDEADDATGAAGAAADGDGDGDGDGDSADEGGDSDGDGDDIVKKNKKKSSAATAPRRKKNMEDDMTLLGVPHGLQFDDAHDDDADDDEFDEEDKDSSEYFQKLKRSVRESYVETYHPETMSHNYDEIQTLARVVRNSAGVIVDDLHRTIPIMTKYEKTRILGQRARQINEGAPAFIKIDSTVIDGYLIAVKELEQKKTPFIIRRPLPNGGSEYWRVQDLEIL
jgi:DNA-directed RNA polymerase I, II, and III subunit RPABC2